MQKKEALQACFLQYTFYVAPECAIFFFIYSYFSWISWGFFHWQLILFISSKHQLFKIWMITIQENSVSVHFEKGRDKDFSVNLKWWQLENWFDKSAVFNNKESLVLEDCLSEKLHIKN